MPPIIPPSLQLRDKCLYVNGGRILVFSGVRFDDFVVPAGATPADGIGIPDGFFDVVDNDISLTNFIKHTNKNNNI